MYVEKELEAFELIDKFLTELSNSAHGAFFSTLDGKSEKQMAKTLMDDHKLIRYRNPSSKTSVADITAEGLAVLREGGFRIYLENKNETNRQREVFQAEIESRELEKVKLEITDLVNRLVDYQTVKNQAKYSIIIAFISILIAIIALFK